MNSTLSAACGLSPPSGRHCAARRAPLPHAAIDLLKELRDLYAPGDYLFPSIRTWKKPISDAAFTAALRRMGYPGDEMRARGFPASFSTIANESGL
jgi:integrase